MLTDKQLNALIRTLLAERKRRRAERLEQSIEAPPAPANAELEAFGALMYRPHTNDHRFTMLDLATALYGPAAGSRKLRAGLTREAVAAGAVGVGKGRVNRPSGESQADYVYSVGDWRTFTVRLLSALSKSQGQ